MRIIGGELRGRVLKEFKGSDIRPTSDMARESLFNILRNQIVNCRFLDLFCGTGAVGIEAISRGANYVCFNDGYRQSVELTKSNLTALGVSERAKVSYADGLQFLKSCAEKFDIIFIDAPYLDPVGEQALANAHLVLAENGVVIYENQRSFSGELENLQKYDERRYGRAYLTFFKAV